MMRILIRMPAAIAKPTLHVAHYVLFHVSCGLLLGALSLSGAVNTNQMPPAARVQVDFDREIRPLLERSCLRCHGAEKPRNHFRLDSREAALKGGDSGVDILPGDSGRSPLIHIVAGVHEDIERMPPKGKGDPLTPDEISLLRAWIDQGVKWSETPAASTMQRRASATPQFHWITVSGDEHKFREHLWMKEGAHAGLENFLLQERLSPDSSIKVEGRLFPDEDNLRVALRYDRTEVGFIGAGVDQFRRYYDDSGGFYPFAQPIFSLDRDLHLRIGKAWFDLGLTLPEWPKVAVGYEYQFKEGTKSTLQWGVVRTTTSPVLPPILVEKNIYPAFKDVDEKTHIVKFDAKHDFVGIFVEDNFRAEFYDLKTHRENALAVTQGQIGPASSVLVNEAHDQFRAVNALRLEKELREWWFVSGGYLYSTADADAAFRQTTVHATGLPISGDFWRSQSIILSQDAVLLNGNMRLGPWRNLVFSSGIQSEAMHQEGVGRVSLDTGNPATFLLIQPATLDANLDRRTLREEADLRFTGLPLTSLFAGVRLEQEALDTFEGQVGGGHDFLHDSDADSDRSDWRAGFYTSPLNAVSLGGHYRQRHKHTHYSDRIDTTASYPAFIRDRTMDTDEFEAKLGWRPLAWLKTTLTYQRVETDFDSATDSIAGTTPGGRLLTGTFEADVYGVGLILTPVARCYFSGTFNYYDSRATSTHNRVPSVVPYAGDIYSVMGSATYNLSTNTDLTASYAFSRADYEQDNFAAGLPLGINYDWHAVQAGITRRFRNVSTNLQYAFYKYTEPTSGGFNDYTAHAVFATLTLRWP